MLSVDFSKNYDNKHYHEMYTAACYYISHDIEMGHVLIKMQV